MGPVELISKSRKEKARLPPVSPESWERYVKYLEELWKKGTDPRWEDWKGGIEQTIAWEKSRNSHPATGPEHYTEKEAERWRAIGLFLCENFPDASVPANGMHLSPGVWRRNAWISGTRLQKLKLIRPGSSGITGEPLIGRREGG